MKYNSITYAMSQEQELFNAITMIFPTILLAYKACTYSNYWIKILFISCLIHLAVSLIYHINVAYDNYEDRIDNNIRRLDQTLQIIIGTIITFALFGCWQYTLCAIIINLIGIYYIWNNETSNNGDCWKCILLCVILYTSPILLQRKYYNYLITIGSIIIGGLCFIPEINTKYFKGWGHSIMHLFTFIHIQSLINYMQTYKIK